MEAEEAAPPCSRRRRGAIRVSLPEGQRMVVTGLSLATDVDRATASAAAAAVTPLVHVWVETVGHGEAAATATAIGNLSLENPVLHVEPAVELAGGELVLCHDSAWSAVRLYGYCRPNPEVAAGAGDDDVDVEGVAGVEVLPEPEEEVRVEYEPLTEEDMAERYDSDNGDDEEEEEAAAAAEEDGHPRKVVGDAAGEAAGTSGESSSNARRKRNSIALVDAPAGAAIVPPDGEFLGPARFAAVKNTAGFMRIAAGAGSSSSKEILVLYRYTRFSRTWSGRRGVEACRRTKLHWLRFAVSPAADDDMGTALAWAGSALGPLIYPALFRRELGDLWSTLLAAASSAAAAIPPGATRLQVVVDAGILRREDYTAERMEHVRAALEAAAGEAWPERYHVGMELRLPEPVRRRREDDGDDGDGGARPAKRRRVVGVEEGDDECSLCLDPMEGGSGSGELLAAWPGCGHVFHGQCVEQTLAGRPTCPLCRRHLFFSDSDDELVSSARPADHAAGVIMNS